MATVEEIKAQVGGLSDDELKELLKDERTGVKDAAQAEIDHRAAAGADAVGGHADMPDEPPVTDWSQNKRGEPGPERPEDAYEDDTPTSSEEVPLEESRKDATTVLATDSFDAEGRRLDGEGHVIEAEAAETQE